MFAGGSILSASAGMTTAPVRIGDFHSRIGSWPFFLGRLT